jgi:hypothetical protein
MGNTVAFTKGTDWELKNKRLAFHHNPYFLTEFSGLAK